MLYLLSGLREDVLFYVALIFQCLAKCKKNGKSSKYFQTNEPIRKTSDCIEWVIRLSRQKNNMRILDLQLPCLKKQLSSSPPTPSFPPPLKDGLHLFRNFFQLTTLIFMKVGNMEAEGNRGFVLSFTGSLSRVCYFIVPGLCTGPCPWNGCIKYQEWSFPCKDVQWLPAWWSCWSVRMRAGGSLAFGSCSLVPSYFTLHCQVHHFCSKL